MYNIVCHDQKKIEVTEEQKDYIYKLSSTNAKGIDINGEYIAFSSISRIEKIKDETPKYPELPTVNEVLGTFSAKRRKRALESMAKGFKKHFEGREMNEEAKKTLLKLQNRINNIG